MTYRTEFKYTGEFLYPLPVIKDRKYLIECHSFHDFYIFCFEEGHLASPDSFPNFLRKKSVHSDGQTEILEIVIDNLYFTYLPNIEKDPQKAETLQTLMSSKIQDILKGEDEAIARLEKLYENQKKCSTCQSLGILAPSVNNFFRSIID